MPSVEMVIVALPEPVTALEKLALIFGGDSLDVKLTVPAKPF